jgi:hypothetical protein
MDEPPFWRKPAAALLAEFATTENGLTSEEATLRLARCGGNDAAAPRAR